MGVFSRDQYQENSSPGESSGGTRGDTNQDRDSVQAPEPIQRPESVVSEVTTVNPETVEGGVQAIVQPEIRVQQET
jgi:hypothetical protein